MSEVKKATLIEKVVAFLKLDEVGKVEKFINRLVKEEKRAVRSLETNLKSLEEEKTRTIEDFKDKLEDAEENVENAYLNVDVEQLSSNDSMSRYSKVYWANLTSAENALDELKKEQEAAIEKCDKDIEGVKSQISKRNARIAKLA